jgi:hypothetical protein
MTRNSKLPAALRVARQVLALSAASLALAGTMAHAASKTYTLDADFSLGILSGVNFTVVPNQLQLNSVGTTFPIMWVANAGEDTISKFDTTANREIARYRTWFGPSGQAGHINHPGNAYSGPAPSRTAVDVDGNAYVLNRFFSGGRVIPVLIKILAEGFVDRNGNGVADTSSDLDNNGIIAGAEIKAMADLNSNGILDPNEITDERIAWAREVGVVNGLGRALCVGTDGNLWVGMFNTRTFYKVRASDGTTIAGPLSTTPTAGQPNAGGPQPYGCLIDANGTLWMASLGSLLGRITNTQSDTGPWTVASFNSGATNYGIALGNGKVYTGLNNRQFDPATNTFSAIPNMVSSYGIVVDGAGNIIGGQSTVRKVSPTGAILWTAPLQAGSASFAVGIQVDSNNDVWQMGFQQAGRMQKYRGTDGAPLGVFPVGDSPYTYSDAAGFSARNITTPTGTWTVTFDGGAANTPWGKVSWTDLVPQGGALVVQMRTANTEADLPNQTYAAVSNGANFNATGRYIQVQTRLNANTAGTSPILYDLTINSRITVCDVDSDGDVDSIDVGLIRSAIGQTPTTGDPRDGNVDGKITINDVRFCTLRCTRTSCATN